ncbi:MAG TPA: hypothetical protein VID27_06985 [Blastocatellia bacterium]|jgi:hypothetical protein
MPGLLRLKIVSIILLMSINTFGLQDREVVELARGVWTAEYEGNVIDVLRIERCKEYGSEPGNSSALFGGRVKVSDGWEMAVFHLRTERVSAKRGLGLWRITAVSPEGKKFGWTVFALGSTIENQFDPVEKFYAVEITVPEGTRFEQVILSRERDDLNPKRSEEIIIDLPGGA